MYFVLDLKGILQHWRPGILLRLQVYEFSWILSSILWHASFFRRHWGCMLLPPRSHQHDIINMVNLVTFVGTGIMLCFFVFLFLFVCFFFCFFRATPIAYGSSQARGEIRTTAASLHHSHSRTGSEPHLWPTPAHGNAITHWERPEIEPTSSLTLVRFISSEPQREHHVVHVYVSLIFTKDRGLGPFPFPTWKGDGWGITTFNSILNDYFILFKKSIPWVIFLSALAHWLC